MGTRLVVLTIFFTKIKHERPMQNKKQKKTKNEREKFMHDWVEAI